MHKEHREKFEENEIANKVIGLGIEIHK